MTTLPRFRRSAAFAAAGALFLGLSVPAAAQSPSDAAPQPAAGAAMVGAAAAAAAPKANATKYCVKDMVTGSRIARKVCKTQQEWAAEGVEIRSK